MPLTPEQQAVYDEAMRVKPRDELTEWREYHAERDRATAAETRRRHMRERAMMREQETTERASSDRDWNSWLQAGLEHTRDEVVQLISDILTEVIAHERAETDKKIAKAVKAALELRGPAELRGTLRSINGAMK
jgi:macrodomain Ter protein organizer (MatP/YcbG family)